jgi:hypothetical protein
MTILKRTDTGQFHARKKVHRIVAVLYMIVLAVVVGMTNLSEQQKLAAKQISQMPAASAKNAQPLANESNLEHY